MEGVKINRATRDVIKRENYPNLEGLPIPGFEFNGTNPEEWLIVVYDSYIGDYDQRYKQIVFTEDEPADRIEHPDYPGVGQWVKHYRLQDLNTDEKLINLENAEQIANEQIMPGYKQFKFMMVALGALLKKVVNNVQPDANEIKAAGYVVRTANKILQNYVIRKGKEQNIEQEPDMDADWITEFEPEDLP